LSNRVCLSKEVEKKAGLLKRSYRLDDGLAGCSLRRVRLDETSISQHESKPTWKVPSSFTALTGNNVGHAGAWEAASSVVERSGLWRFLGNGPSTQIKQTLAPPTFPGKLAYKTI
jgi:hypothetical protein